MTPLSNLHRRVLEYLIVEAIIQTQPKATLTLRAKNAQDRDIDKLKNINSALLQQLNWATHAFLNKWLEPRFQISKHAPILSSNIKKLHKVLFVKRKKLNSLLIFLMR
jgi:hypothetical protein